MKQQKMIINRSLYCNWRFEGCGDDWDNFINAYGFSPQLLIDGKVKEYCSTIETYSKLLVRFKKQ